jgi:hypothetical protein
MRKQLATLAVTTLLLGPFMAPANSMMPSDNDFEPGMMGNGQLGTDEGAGHDTIKAEIMKIDGNQLIAEAEDGHVLVFVADQSIGHLTVGDKLEARVDQQTKSAEILNVVPRHQDAL